MSQTSSLTHPNTLCSPMASEGSCYTVGSKQSQDPTYDTPEAKESGGVGGRQSTAPHCETGQADGASQGMKEGLDSGKERLWGNALRWEGSTLPGRF